MVLSPEEKKRAVFQCKIIWALIVGFTIGLIILLSVLIPSFKYVGYNKYAFKQHRFGEVDRNHVYTQGRYVIPPIYKIITLPATYQLIDITSPIFSDLGLEFDLHLVVYYQLPKDSLGEIYHQFSLNYDNRITNIVKTTVKDIATNYSVDDYVKNRDQVESIFSLEVHQQLKSAIGIDIPELYFRLLDVTFPATVLNSSLISAIELQNNQIQKYKQDVLVIEADTTTMLTAITVQTNLVLATANIDAAQLVSNSVSEANSIITSARGEGINSVLGLLNITTPTYRDEFIRLASILDATTPKILSGDFSVLLN